VSRTAHFVLLLLTLFSVCFILHLVRRRQLRAKYALLWLSAGAALVVMAASPAMLESVADALGVDYAPSAFFMGAIAFLFLIVIHFSWELSRLEERTRVLAEEIAILRGGELRPPTPPAVANRPAGPSGEVF